jgi:hypothetical protein
MPNPWSPYPDYLPPGIDLFKEDREREARRTTPHVTIDYRPHKRNWKAYWNDTISLLGKFEGTREECIAWARERCDDIRICSDPDDPNAYLMQLGPDDE